MHNGWSTPHDYYLRGKRCGNCEATFVTAEVVVDGSTLWRLDDRGRQYRREYYRRTKGKSKGAIRQPGKYRGSDELFVTTKVIPWKKP